MTGNNDAIRAALTALQAVLEAQICPAQVDDEFSILIAAAPYEDPGLGILIPDLKRALEKATQICNEVKVTEPLGGLEAALANL